MRKKVFWSLVGFSLAISVLLCGLLTGGMYLYFNQQLRAQLVSESNSLASLINVQQDKAAFLQDGVYIDRVTLIDTDGTVLYDSQGDVSTMENHALRNEVVSAMESGSGWGSRNSVTLGEVSVYYAQKLDNGQVLRVAGTQKNVLSMLRGVILWFVLGLVVCALLSSQLAKPITKALVKPLDAIDLDSPLQSDVYEELAPMLRRMDAQNRRIVSQMNRLKRQQAELSAILSGLREGLVVLDERHRVLAINPAARAILGAGDGELVDRPILEINRHETLVRLLKQNTGVGELCSAGRIYRVSASIAGEDLGMVLLMQDVTEERMAEQNRQQFSANVSHELRTPLTTISGYAELLATGLAKPEDTAELAGKIHQESKRMLSLIEDIIRLSKLDEGAVGEKQPIDLLLLAQSCVSKLGDFAEKQSITVTVEGDSAVVFGDRTLLEEMMVNLIDNAIKYNKPNGRVQITVGMEGDQPRFSVVDTGVGIPVEHQPRVFERFYRVDKSRSKDTGGTGLGLSIVKHGAQLHGAEIKLQSAPAKGTSITLLFPKQNQNA
ncbi:MAG: ATP-binding protein [Eubacteriales bacterium]|nr:ATP-binding protein [Eubacteriales bacterium]